MTDRKDTPLRSVPTGAAPLSTAPAVAAPSDGAAPASSTPASSTPAPSTALGPRKVPVSWEALEDAFENNAHEIHSYLHTHTGEVIRIVDGVADPQMHTRVMADATYLRIDPVSSREQYRWMERFIASVDEINLRRALGSAIDGKGAFRRFKDALMNFPLDRERWFTFRSERLRACMAAWLEAHGIEAVDRPEWTVPSADEVRAKGHVQEPPAQSREDYLRGKIAEHMPSLEGSDLESLAVFVEALHQKRIVQGE